ncbi:hypothetical protein [Bradyrhizobium sp. 195]|uniref:hypothetical protein n=1 Tax=Bradyrhizobium sp. 195 TaxID=2782662 RepID=UPI002000D310|nr:hypothetical protein [Bradyrhizobium sp. 195]UPK31343.1 hypothetical protein IVB26_38600 [Bradyrhizobium sp. 195]
MFGENRNLQQLKAKAHSPSGLTDKLSVHVRMEEALIMTVSATIEVVGAPAHGKRSNLS